MTIARSTKLTIVGAGSVGTSLAYAALIRGSAREVVLYDIATAKVEAEVLDLAHGTPFQQAVWRALLQIGRGQTTRYGALATQIGLPRAVRAVGAAVGRNPLSVVVPCHRVVGADGSLTGYAGGVDKKRRLLALEGLDVSRFA